MTGSRIAVRGTAVKAVWVAVLISAHVALAQNAPKAEARAPRSSASGKAGLPSLGAMAENVRKHAEQLVALAAQDSLVVPPPSLEVVASPDLSDLLLRDASGGTSPPGHGSGLLVVATPVTEDFEAALLSAANAYATLATALNEYEAHLHSQGQDASVAVLRLHHAKNNPPATNAPEGLLTEAMGSTSAAMDSLRMLMTKAWLHGASAAATDDVHRDRIEQAAAAFDAYLQLRSAISDRDAGISDAMDALQDGLTRVYSELAPSRVAEVRRKPRRHASAVPAGPEAELLRRHSLVTTKLREFERAASKDPQIKALRKELAARKGELGELERSLDARIQQIDPVFRGLLAENGAAQREGRNHANGSRAERELAERRRAHLKDAELSDVSRAILAKKQEIQQAEQAVSKRMTEDPEYRALRQEQDSLMSQYRELRKAEKSRWGRDRSSKADARRGRQEKKGRGRI